MGQNLNEGFRSIEIRAMQAVLEDEFTIQINDIPNLKTAPHKESRIVISPSATTK